MRTFRVSCSAAALLSALCAVHIPHHALPIRSNPRDADLYGRQTTTGESFLKLPCDVRRRTAGGHSTAPARMLTVTLPGLLANLMFAVAALEGLSDSLQREPHLSIDASCLLGGDIKANDLSRRRVQAFAAAFGIHLCEGTFENVSWYDTSHALGWGRYDAQLLMLNKQMEVAGSQRAPGYSSDLGRIAASFSPQYFDHLGRDYFRKLFAFPRHVMEKARDFVDGALAEYSDSSRLLRCRLVGIHVRRGDKNWEFHMFNEWSHGASYIQRAIDVSGKLFGGEAQAPLLYVVTTDDPTWVRAAMGSMSNLVISPFTTSAECKMDINCHEPLVDMAILSLCDVIVVSGSSTYSWWAAYLSADSSVVIAPRLPVNPRGEFGPCVTTGHRHTQPQHEHELLPLTAQRPTNAERCDPVVDELPNGAGASTEAWCRWMPGGKKHVRCGAFWSEEYYPDDWILLDEVCWPAYATGLVLPISPTVPSAHVFDRLVWQHPAFDVFPDWWGPLVTSVQHADKTSLSQPFCGEAGDGKCRAPSGIEGDGREDKPVTHGGSRPWSLAASVLHAPEDSSVCTYIDGSLRASLPAHGSGEALAQVTIDAGSRGEHTALVCVAGASPCPQYPHLDPDCVPSAFSLVFQDAGPA